MSMPEVQNSKSPTTTTSPTTPRRKRRRPAATGAANDCFTCTTNNVQCDRKRPYCTPCLTGGKDCAGYRTTLTWGVGVASRGKLRGLSLPVAGSAQPTPARSQSGIRKRPSAQDAALPRRRLQKSLIMAASADLFSPLSPIAFPQTQPAPDASRAVWTYPTSPMQQQIPSQQILLSSSRTDEPPPSSQSDQSQYSVPHLIDERFREPSYVSPDEPARPSESNGYFNYPPLPPKGRSYSLNAATSGQRHNLTLWSPQPFQEGSSPSISDDSSLSHVSFPWHASDFGALEPERTASNWTPKASTVKHRGGKDVGEAASGLGQSQTDGHGTVYREAVVPEQIAIVLTPPPSGTQSIGKTPRMRYLIQYYAEVMTPVLVAFDGPTNPFRVHILRMASGSDTLQHAISALAASNLRQRGQIGQVSSGATESAKRSSLAYLRLTDKAWHTMPGFLPTEEQRQEEGYHKNATVQLMQQQFSDPSQYRDNALLATLLIVCLYHMCESGIAKFRAHFAAAKKLLGMHEIASIMNSEELRWLARMLTLYDTMTATTSDREPEMQQHLIEMSSSSGEAWTMETLAGCDGQLFKTVTRLGRLKVLGDHTLNNITLMSPNGYLDPPNPAGTMPYWGHFSGDVWRNNEVQVPVPQHPDAANEYPNVHTIFGREWSEIRNSLLSWNANVIRYGGGRADLPSLSDDQQLDLLNMSEAYRFSALVYVERLALASSPCSDSRIQAWVQKALHHIHQVRNNVHLLWPLFIAGSECITESERQLVRQRCLEIQKDSGFASNTSCLRILDQIWMTNPEPCLEFIPPPGFRWAPFLRCNTPGGEYLVL